MIQLVFIINSILLGFGLAMDAFTVTIANTISVTNLKKSKIYFMSIMFGFFQFIMPVIGYVIVRYISIKISYISNIIHIIAFILLLIIGIKMIYESISNKIDSDIESTSDISIITIIIQAIATSIDAMSTGFAFAKYNIEQVLVASFIIAIVTFILCIVGAAIGKKFGLLLARKAKIYGGIILILIGLKILFKN